MRKLKVILLFFLATPGLAELSRSDLDKLSSEKIIEYARMGEAEAQYWLGMAIFKGAIANWSSYGDYLLWIEMAAEQDHELAMSHIASTYSNSKDPKLKSKGISHLRKLAAKNWPEAHLSLSYYYSSKGPEQNQTLRKFHLERAAEANLGAALAKLGLVKFMGHAGFLQDKNAGLELMNQSFNGTTNRFFDKNYEDVWQCNTIHDLDRIYSKKDDFFGEAVGLEDPLKQIEILELGVLKQCPLTMYQYADLLIDEEPRNVSRALNLLLELHNMGENQEGWVQKGIAELLFEDGDFDGAKHFSALALKAPRYSSLDDIIFSTIKAGGFEIAFGIGARICRQKKIKLEDCKEYILSN